MEAAGSGVAGGGRQIVLSDRPRERARQRSVTGRRQQRERKRGILAQLEEEEKKKKRAGRHPKGFKSLRRWRSLSSQQECVCVEQRWWMDGGGERERERERERWWSGGWWQAKTALARPSQQTPCLQRKEQDGGDTFLTRWCVRWHLVCVCVCVVVCVWWPDLQVSWWALSCLATNR